MTPQQIALVRTSWQELVPYQEEIAGLFYPRLFALDPGLRPLFKGDIKLQGRKLVAMLATVIDKLDRLDTLMRDIQSLGRMHVHWGVKDEHYDAVGRALLATFEDVLGEVDFPPETRAAWATAYGALADTMRIAAAGAKAA